MRNRPKSRSFRLGKREKGQANVEFALSLMAFFFVIFCSWELLMAMYTISVLGDAAKEGVRYAIVNGSTNHSQCSNAPGGTPCSTDPFNVKGRVLTYAQASGHDISALTVNVSYPDTTNDVPNRVIVNVTYTYVPYISLSFFHPTVTTSAEGRIVY